MSHGITIRCRSKSDLARYHEIIVEGLGRVRCSADGGFCAHIDAVINYGLTAMVHPDDRHLVSKARAISGPIVPTAGWKASWMRDATWISGRDTRTMRSSRNASSRSPTNRPGVCFSGKDPNRNRRELAEEAETCGWTYTPEVISLTQILVVAEKSSTSGKTLKALRDGVPLCDYEEWRVEVSSPSWTRG